MGRYQLENGGGEIEVIAGNYKETKGPASTFTPIHMMNAKLNAGGSADFSFPAHFNTMLLVVSGRVLINGSEEAPLDHAVLMANDGEDFTIQASEDSVVLILSGEPIQEPIAAYGPFVMNTKQELIQAFDDYNKGKFGYLEE
jgi:redox-sensitive bicupin YhaK (pirin superfamily)